MEREKLEKASKEAFDNFYARDPIMDDTFRSIFEQGAKWTMSQPLCDRLTDVEKEQIKAIYFRNVYSVADVQSNFTEKCLIDAIFGTELFNEE